MASSAISSSSGPGPTDRASQSEVVAAALARAVKRQDRLPLTLVRLVEQVTPPGDKGQHVDYYA